MSILVDLCHAFSFWFYIFSFFIAGSLYMPPSVIVWAFRLSPLHLLISETLCSEKGNCQQWIYNGERESRKQRGVKCVISSQREWRLKKEEEKRTRGAGSDWILEKRKIQKGYFMFTSFPNYQPCFFFILPFDLLYLHSPTPIHKTSPL